MAIGMERLSSKPTAPKSGYDILYTKAGGLYMEDANGIETQITGGGGGTTNNFGASTAPTVNADSSAGYAVGSMWLDTTNNNLYMAKSVAVGAASWMKIAVKNNFTATTYPGVTDDIAAGYSIGSTWINQAVNATFIAKDVSAGKAIWRSVAMSYGVSNAAPTANEDVDDGYAVGSFWYDYSANAYYICDSAASGAAVWLKLAVPCNLTATAAPGVGDDNLDGYAIGSFWLDTTNNNLYMAKSVGTGAASWMKLGTKNNYGATTAPTVSDDISAGYGIGSLWYDTTGGYTYRARSVAAGAALWTRVEARWTVSTVAPTVNNDSTVGYAIGSTWWDNTNHVRYFCTDATTGAAVWKTTPVEGYAWDIGGVEIRALTFQSDVATGTAPFTVASTTAVSNLNADLLDGNHASAFLTSLSGAVLANGTVPLTAAWDAGSYQIRAETLQSDVTTGTAPLTVASTTKVTNLNADQVDGYNASLTHGVYTVPVSSQYTGQIADDFICNAGGSRAQNRIGNYGAEIDTSGWATYADAAGAVPVNGTGGSPTVTWTRTTTGPLRGDGAFLFTKDAANRQGEGASYDFTIENSEQTAVFKVAMDYAIVSGTYATGDLTVYLYDVTNGVLIYPSSYQIATGTTALPFVFETYFQAPISTSYRLIIHVASTSSSAYTLQFDGIRVAVEPQSRGPIVTDYVSYTPTGAWTSNTTYVGKWRRIGDQMEVRFSVTTTGTPTTAEFYLNLPTGYTIDTAKLLDTGGANNAFGQAMVLDSGTDRYAAIVSYLSTTAVRIQVMPHGSTYTGINTSVTQAVPMTFTTNDMIVGWFAVPISGWSSNVVLSSDADIRTVEASYYMSGSSANAKLAYQTAEIVDFDTKIVDTHNAVTTGASWKFTAPISGYYIVTSGIRLSAATPAAASSAVVNYIYVDGVLVTSGPVTRANQTASSVNYSCQATGIQYVAAGGKIEIYGYQSIVNADTTLDVSGTYYNFVHIIRMGGPQTITPVETVMAHYENSAGTSCSNAKETTLPFATKVIDTHNGFATNTYTIPITGTYIVTAHASPLGSTNTITDCVIMLRGTGGSELGRGWRGCGNASTYTVAPYVTIIRKFNAGDTVYATLYQTNNNSAALSLESDTATANQFFIARIGL